MLKPFHDHSCDTSGTSYRLPLRPDNHYDQSYLLSVIKDTEKKETVIEKLRVFSCFFMLQHSVHESGCTRATPGGKVFAKSCFNHTMKIVFVNKCFYSMLALTHRLKVMGFCIQKKAGIIAPCYTHTCTQSRYELTLCFFNKLLKQKMHFENSRFPKFHRYLTFGLKNSAGQQGAATMLKNNQQQ